MSNNLILIIAADYRAFSSSKQKQDLYEENVKHSQTKNHVSSTSHVPKYQQVNEKCINPKQVLGCELLQGNKDTITQNVEVPERVLEIVAQNHPKKLPSDQYSYEIKRSLLPLEVDEISYKECEKKPIPARINYQRSKSDRPCRVRRVVIDESINRMRRSETINVEAKVEENEFTTMTNEELNRRVEEFIHKFHRQIRLQATILSNR
ncbi:hypothetical protein SESBI_07757 [Sesbania bispinosa]|nr:hypothetical protein SESBI_07757 [Sesbania bispinosa]